MMVRTSRPTARTAVTPQTTYIALCHRGINLRLTVLVLPTVSGGVQDVVGGGAHCLDGGGGLVGDVVGVLVVASIESLPLRIS